MFAGSQPASHRGEKVCEILVSKLDPFTKIYENKMLAKNSGPTVIMKGRHDPMY